MDNLETVLEEIYSELAPEGKWENIPLLYKFRAKGVLQTYLAELKYYYENEIDKAHQEGYEQGCEDAED